MKSIKVLDIKEINTVGFSEGWGIFHTGIQNEDHNLYELQKWDDAETAWPYETDMEAIRSVAFMAISEVEEGRNATPHADAIHFLCMESPEEINKQFRFSLDECDFKEMCEVLQLEFLYGIKP